MCFKLSFVLTRVRSCTFHSLMSERTPLNATYKDPSALAHLSRLKNYQKYVFFITFGSYFMSHFSRKCVSGLGGWGGWGGGSAAGGGLELA